MEQNSIIENKTTSSEMRNVTLSSETKEFLVAYRMTQDVGDLVIENMLECWGDLNEKYIEKEMDPLWRSIGEVQRQILRLMTNVIDQNLGFRDSGMLRRYKPSEILSIN
ncbi:hypothetical protein [Proteiniphilum sp. UBA1028]|jgi:hypothetical protein|uniref:hypothetical protein n=1 Tax=Proteiniphilum sp. UBA1028 TaxID=1947251 RepID=UPI0025FF6C07|nr:hypothetical protein [Proteiniphilum sp. UBA1028]